MFLLGIALSLALGLSHASTPLSEAVSIEDEPKKEQPNLFFLQAPGSLPLTYRF